MDPQRQVYTLIREGNMAGLRKAFQENPGLCSTARPYGQSLPLHAVLEGKTTLLAFLIEQGCDVDDGDDEMGLTPLHAAALNQDAEAVKALLDAGAEVEKKDKFGNTPLFRAVFAYQGDLSVVSLLIEHGADPDHRNKSGISPIGLAKNKGIPELVMYLKQRGANDQMAIGR